MALVGKIQPQYDVVQYTLYRYGSLHEGKQSVTIVGSVLDSM